MAKDGLPALLNAMLLFLGDTQADAAPAPLPSPSASAEASSVVGPALGVNDPCVTLSAIVTRPSQTTSVCTVRPNHILLETGYQNTTFDATSSSVQYPQALIRVGTTIPGLELDVAPASAARMK